jgi:hypothetical protein
MKSLKFPPYCAVIVTLTPILPHTPSPALHPSNTKLHPASQASAARILTTAKRRLYIFSPIFLPSNVSQRHALACQPAAEPPSPPDLLNGCPKRGGGKRARCTVDVRVRFPRGSVERSGVYIAGRRRERRVPSLFFGSRVHWVAILRSGTEFARLISCFLHFASVATPENQQKEKSVATLSAWVGALMRRGRWTRLRSAIGVSISLPW